MMEFRVGCWVQRSFGRGWCSPRLVREENQQVQGSNPRRSVCVPLGLLLVLGGGVAQVSCKLSNPSASVPGVGWRGLCHYIRLHL